MTVVFRHYMIPRFTRDGIQSDLLKPPFRGVGGQTFRGGNLKDGGKGGLNNLTVSNVYDFLMYYFFMSNLKNMKS